MTRIFILRYYMIKRLFKLEDVHKKHLRMDLIWCISFSCIFITYRHLIIHRNDQRRQPTIIYNKRKHRSKKIVQRQCCPIDSSFNVDIIFLRVYLHYALEIAYIRKQMRSASLSFISNVFLLLDELKLHWLSRAKKIIV